jgi:hypothetical protein
MLNRHLFSFLKIEIRWQTKAGNDVAGYSQLAVGLSDLIQLLVLKVKSFSTVYFSLKSAW